MINVSDEYKKLILEDREFICSATITLTDGTVLSVSNDNILSSGFNFDDGVSGNGTFVIGAAVINKFTLILDNTELQYSSYDFTGAVIRPGVGLQLSSTIESFKKGLYTVDKASTPGDTIKLSALDNMSKFEKDYDSALSYPATLQAIVQDACIKCGVMLGTTTFTNSSYVVAEKPTEEMTYLSVISYAAQIAGCFARCNINGYLELKWYDFSVFENEDRLDGGNLLDYSSGATAEGANFDDYSSGNAYDGGNFEQNKGYYHIYKLSSQDICTDDVVITGIQVTDYAKNSEDTETYLYGYEGYVLSIGNNPFIQQGMAQTVATFLGNKIIGIRFRPLSVSAQCDPSIEAGDMAYVSDRRGNAYQCCITNLSLSVGGWATYICDAETPSRNSASPYSVLTKAIVKARDLVEREKNLRQQMIDALNERLNNSPGTYATIQPLADGSNIYYLHDKPTLAESMIIWKMTAEAWAVSTDGGKKYLYGMTVDGNTIVNILSAVGVDANWIRTGTLNADLIRTGMIKSINGNSYWDLVNNQLRLTGSFESKENKYRALLTSGKLTYYAGENYSLGSFKTVSYNGVNGIAISPDISRFLTFCQNPFDDIVQDGGWGYMYNQGVNPHGYTDAHVFAGDVRIYASNLKVDGGLHATRVSPFYNNVEYKTFSVSSDLLVTGDISCLGTKYRAVETENYGTVGMNAFETMGAHFADIGSGSIQSGGKCYVYLHPIFMQTIDMEQEFQVFITKTSNKEFVYVEKQSDHFIVHGENGLTFDWQVIAKQRGYQNDYGEKIVIDTEEPIDYDESIFREDNAAETSADEYLENYYKEIENYD